MHSSRMHTARSLTISRSIPCISAGLPNPLDAHPLPLNANPLPGCRPHPNACWKANQPFPSEWIGRQPPPPSACWQDYTQQAPPAPREPTDRCKNITFANFV